MKTKIVIIALASISLALLIAFFVSKSRNEEQVKADKATIENLTREAASIRQTNSEILSINGVLRGDVAAAQSRLAALSNDLAATGASLTESRTALNSAQEQIAGLNTRIAGMTTQISDLEQQNKSLDTKAAELSAQIALLNQQIAETSAKLATANGNNAFLQRSLQKQMAEKAALERQFNDLDALRSQVQRIKGEQYAAHRAFMLKNRVGDRKGAELLMSPLTSSRDSGPRPPSNLNVEIGSDGSVRVIQPISPTNTPAK